MIKNKEKSSVISSIDLNWRKFLAIFCVIFFTACDSGAETQIIQRYLNTNALLHGEARIEDAEGFDLVYRDGYRILQTFSQEVNAEHKILAKEYLLLPRSSPRPLNLPAEISAITVIYTPIESLITSSTTQISLLNALESEQVLVGHSDNLVWNPTVRSNLESGQVAVIGAEQNLNVELVLDIHPNLYMSVANNGVKSNSYSILESAGIPLLENSEYLETTVLGRAEWIKLMGALVDKEEQANRIYTEVKRAYLELKKLSSMVDNKPDIILNTPFRGTWYVPGGAGYMAQLIEDAGGDYYFADEASSKSIVVSFEEMIALGLQADIWLNPSVERPELDAVAQLDSRLRELKPFQNGELYNYSRRIADNGANDYWESGVVYPDRLLADLIKIFHPRLLPEHELFYYQKLQ